MEAKVEKIKTVTIILNSQEAEILADLVQNPQVPPNEEPYECSRLRERIFKACKG